MDSAGYAWIAESGHPKAKIESLRDPEVGSLGSLKRDEGETSVADFCRRAGVNVLAVRSMCPRAKSGSSDGIICGLFRLKSQSAVLPTGWLARADS